MTDDATAPEELEGLVDAARRWRDADPDPETRDRTDAAIERGDPAELAALFRGRIAFGTAGLRGPIGPGPNGLNRLVARQTAAGLAEVIRRHHGDATSGAPGAVIVGHDARHGSATFARDIVDVLTGAGIAATLVDQPTPTPVVAWAIRRLGGVAGVVVTASHNPPADNGIKVYWGDGAQIVPPIDGEIAAAIGRAAERGNPPGAGEPSRVVRFDPALLDEYVRRCARPPFAPDDAAIGAMRVVTTSMHGVGHELLHRALRAAGCAGVTAVAAQAAPDPDFPTVAFPNPEEPGATDLLLDLARREGADVALANDPDADRLAVGLPGRDGAWRMLRGDEVGALFAAGLLEADVEAGHDPSTALLASTVVSSQLTARVAAAAGARFAETLTGFKWLCRPAFEHPEWRQLVAYEEALGYAVGPDTFDKDGISAAVAFVALLALWAHRGRTAWDVLDRLARDFGAHEQRNFSLRIEGSDWAERLSATAASVVADPPTALGGAAVERVDQPAHDVIRLFLVGGGRVVIRPSGTEPKLKCYCEAVEPVADDEPVDRARGRATARLDRIRDELVGILNAPPS